MPPLADGNGVFPMERRPAAVHYHRCRDRGVYSFVARAMCLPIRNACALAYSNAKFGEKVATRFYPAAPIIEIPQINSDYSNREGYDPKFLGIRSKTVPLPQLTMAPLTRATFLGLAFRGRSGSIRQSRLSVPGRAARRR